MPHYTETLLRERCEMYRSEFLGDGLAVPGELEPYWPGGEHNKLEDPVDAWILAYARCFWIDGRREGRKREKESREGADDRQRLILAAQRAEPQSVELVEPLADGSPRIVFVYPKSAVALDEMKARSLALARLADDTEALERSEMSTDDLDLVIRAIDERRYLEHLLLWIAITPGPGLPYEWGTRAPELPAEHLFWTPADFFLVVNAFQQVNAGRAAALDAGKNSAARADFTGFWATMSVELQRPISQLTRDYSLLELIATASELARAREESIEAAKQHSRET